jgi:Tol biopolymer transport system component
MDEMTEFEQQFADRVRAFAHSGVQPVDSAAVAHAVAAGQPRDHGAGWLVRWHGLTLDRRAWTIAIALGLLVAFIGGALLAGARLPLPPRLSVSPPASNGWIAFTAAQPAPDGSLDADTDIWLVALDRDARRVVGGETDRVNQLCPAFSPDGRSLAYGRVEGHGTSSFVNADGTEGSEPNAYRRAALVVADVSTDGHVSDRLTIDLGDGLPPPCPVWSPDGGRVAFGVNRTSPVNPERSAVGSQVWIATLADRGVTVLPDLLATDLEWSPDASLLAIASGTDQQVSGGALGDGRIRLFGPASGAMRTLEATSGAIELTWSPDGRSIAYAGVGDSGSDDHRELRIIDVETGRQRVLAARYGILHGIGPVWSPDGKTIAYQRGYSGEHSEVVLSTPGDLSDQSTRPRETVVSVTARGSSARLDPYRVTWSPDGQYLLMMAWGNLPDTTGTVEDPFVVAIPADAAMPNVVLSRMHGLVVHDGYPDTTLVPIQTWGRAP